MAAAVKGYITLTFTVRLDEETHCFVGHCVELGTSSSGENIEAAFEALDEATCLYLNTLEDVGERPRVFKERGIRIEKVPPEEVEVKVRPGDYARSRSLPYTFA